MDQSGTLIALADGALQDVTYELSRSNFQVCGRTPGSRHQRVPLRSMHSHLRRSCRRERSLIDSLLNRDACDRGTRELPSRLTRRKALCINAMEIDYGRSYGKCRCRPKWNPTRPRRTTQRIALDFAAVEES